MAHINKTSHIDKNISTIIDDQFLMETMTHLEYKIGKYLFWVTISIVPSNCFV